jgi:hypothetical protein
MSETMTVEEYRDIIDAPKSNKYHAKPMTVDGIHFDSQAEARRYGELRILERAGGLTRLVCHRRFPLSINGTKICDYEDDFDYTTPDGRYVVEDVKSPATKTALYRVKRNLMKALHGIDIVEVEA